MLLQSHESVERVKGSTPTDAARPDGRDAPQFAVLTSRGASVQSSESAAEPSKLVYQQVVSDQTERQLTISPGQRAAIRAAPQLTGRPHVATKQPRSFAIRLDATSVDAL